MATFGETLRRERELRGITLLELATATKIHFRHLEALENDQFGHLPGGVFNRGFVRAVARYMKLDEHHWVGEFVRAAREEPEVLARYAPPGPPPAPSRRGLWSFAVLLAVFGVGAYAVHEVRLRLPAQASETQAPAPAAVREAPAPVTTPPAPEPTRPAAPANVSLPAGAPARPAARPQITPGELRLQVDALDDAWVSIAVDGQPLYSGLMKPGETRSFRGGERITVTTGNASALVLTLNGETLPPLGNPGERKNLTLTAQDLKLSTP